MHFEWTLIPKQKGTINPLITVANSATEQQWKFLPSTVYVLMAVINFYQL